MEAGILQKTLKNSKNIAIVADTASNEDSLCASIALMELIKEFLAVSEGFVVSVYFLAPFPQKCEKLVLDTKVYEKIGVRTLTIKFPVEGADKILYNLDKDSNEFNFSLVGFKGTKVNIVKNSKYTVKSEKIDFVLGVGFKSESDLEKQVPYTKKITDKHVFNTDNMKSKNLCDGVFDMFCKEGIRPSALASKAFLTYFS